MAVNITDISKSTYASKSYNPSAQIGGTSNGTQFSSDGTKMYIVRTNTSTIYQYTLSTPWDISTASYASKNYSVSSGFLDSSGTFLLSNDGTKMYTAQSGTIYQYTLSTPWDISTASYASKNYSASTNIRGMFMSKNGTYLYVSDNQASTYRQYTLSTSFDISTCSLTASVAAGTLFGTSSMGPVFMNDNGATIFGYGPSGTIRQVPLSTPWLLSSYGAYTKSVNVSAQGGTNAAHALFCNKDDGSTFYLTGNWLDVVYQYNTNQPTSGYLPQQHMLAIAGGLM